MSEDGKFKVDGRPVQLTPEEAGRIRRLQLIMVAAAVGGVWPCSHS